MIESQSTPHLADNDSMYKYTRRARNGDFRRLVNIRAMSPALGSLAGPSGRANNPAATPANILARPGRRL